VFGDTDRVGLYTVVRGERREAVPINLCDPKESRGDVEDSLKTGTGGATQASAMPAPVKQWWRWLAAAALLVLLVEWFVYHRRVGL
jgi:hypothetical protein